MSRIQIFDFSFALSNTLLMSLILLLPVLCTGLLMLIHRPRFYEAVGMMLGVLLNIPCLLLLNILAENIGWWSYTHTPNSFYNIPVEIILGWAVFWGAFIPYLCRSLPLIIPVIAAVLLDLWLMPQFGGLFALGENWLIGEAVVIMACLVPALLIFRLTAARKHVFIRALIQSYIWGGWIVFLIPAVILSFEGQDIFSALDWSMSRLLLFAAGLAVAFIIGYAGLWEFADKGKGTPIPLDPPQKLVTTGIYSYVANPLQISTMLIFINIAVAYESILMTCALAAQIIYCEIFVRWHHETDIEQRFGEDWLRYKRTVRNWIPMIRERE